MLSGERDEEERSMDTEKKPQEYISKASIGPRTTSGGSKPTSEQECHLHNHRSTSMLLVRTLVVVLVVVDPAIRQTLQQHLRTIMLLL
jgi:hypothetical protein